MNYCFYLFIFSNQLKNFNLKHLKVIRTGEKRSCFVCSLRKEWKIVAFAEIGER